MRGKISAHITSSGLIVCNDTIIVLARYSDIIVCVFHYESDTMVIDKSKHTMCIDKEVIVF